MKNYLFLCIVALMSSTSLFAKDLVFDASQMFTNTRQEEVMGKNNMPLAKCPANTLKTMSLTKSFADNIFLSGNNKITLTNFPINSVETGTIQLTSSTPAVDANTKWVKASKNGIEKFQGPNIACYTGAIAGMEDTKVFVSYSGGNMFGYVLNPDGLQYDITTLKEQDNKGRFQISVTEQNFRFRIDPDSKPYLDLNENSPVNSTEFDDLAKISNQALGNSSQLLEVRIAIDGRYNYYQLMGYNADKAAAYIASVMSHVSNLYQDYVNVKLYLPYIKIRTDEESDPYTQKDLSTFSDVLHYMPTVWSNAEDRPENSALVCMFASLKAQQASGGGYTAGISFTGGYAKGTLCDNAIGYSIFGVYGTEKFPNYNYTWDVSVAAHEMGHNFGLPHTHNCEYYKPPIDTCVTKQTLGGAVDDACFDGSPKPVLGTIMSYCHVTNSTNSVALKFHPREMPIMRKVVMAAVCAAPPKNPFIGFLAPLTTTSYVSGDKLPIRWTSSQVNNVNLFYTINDGASWEPIASNIPANDSVYNWTAPKINTTNLLFKVVDNAKDTVFTISDVKISITIPVLAFTSPTKNAEYSQSEIIEVQWSSNVSKRYNFFFSTNDGQNWDTLAMNTTATLMQFDAPDIESSDCRFLVQDADRYLIAKFSPQFTIGKESLTINDPKPGDTICGDYAHSIQWTSKNVYNITLQYSTNAGAKWINLFKGTSKNSNANLQKVWWPVPDIKCDSVMVRAVLGDDNTIVLSTVGGTFSIDTCLMVGVKEDYVGSTVKIISVSPNPANNLAIVKFNTNEFIQNAELTLISAEGNVVFTQNISQPVNGENTVSLNLEGLAQGKYFVSLKAGQAILHYPITIVR